MLLNNKILTPTDSDFGISSLEMFLLPIAQLSLITALLSLMTDYL